MFFGAICVITIAIACVLYWFVMKLDIKSKKQQKREIILVATLFVAVFFIVLGNNDTIRKIFTLSKPDNLIATSAALLTGLAFFVQYLANKQVQKQFKFQQFESHIYKLVDIYRENVLRWKKQDKKSFEDCTDRLVAVNVLETYDILFEEVKSIIIYWKSQNASDFYTKIYRNELENIFKEYNGKDIGIDNLEFWLKSELTYIILFFGVEEKGIENLKYFFANKLNNTFLIELTNLLSHKISMENYGIKGFHSTFKIDNVGFYEKSKFDLKEILEKNIYYETFSRETFPDSIYTYKYYNGIETLFSHHYRHLYNTFSYINKNNDIDYKTRWKTYANLIRTQMTNTEQILFYLNSISFLGRDWELNHLTSRKKPNAEILNKRLITKYDIIKNIPKGDRDHYKIELFYPDIEWEDLSMNSTNNDVRYQYRKRFEDKYYN